MDEYGFAAAARAGLEIFETASRRSGRTSRMIERVKAGDIIVCPHERMADSLRHSLKLVGKEKVRVVVIPASTAPDLHPLRGNAGRTFFEHTWVSAYFEAALHEADRQLEGMQRGTSVSWPDPPEYDKAAEPFMRWR